MLKSRSSRRLDLQRSLRYFTRIRRTFLGLSPGSGENRPLIVLFLIAIIGITALISLGLLALGKKDTSIGIIDLTLASILIANLFHARRYRHYAFNIYLGITLTGLLFIYLFVTGGVNRSGAFIWYYTFPLIASFVLGSKRGAVATALILLPVIGLFLMKNPPPFFINYSFDFKVRFLSSFLVVFIFSYLFEYSREKSRDELHRSYHDLEKRVDERTLDLQKAIHSLQKEVNERREIEEALRQSEDRYRDVVESSHYLICTHDLKGQILSVNQKGARLLGYEQKDLLNKNVRDFLAPEFRDEFDTYLETVRKQGAAKGLMLLQTATGERRIWEYNNTLRTEGVASPIVRCMAHDVTERIESARSVKRLSQENTIMAEIGQIISSTLNIEEVYDRFAEKVRKLIPFDRISINTINREEQLASATYTAGVDVSDRRIRSVFPLAGTVTGEVSRTRSSLLIQGETIEEITNRFPGLSSSFRAGLRSTISVPLISKDQVIAVLIIQSLKPNAYKEMDLRLAERVGNQIAGAIANAQLFAERKRAEETVTRLSQEHAILAEIGRIFTSSLDIDEVYEAFGREVGKIISFDRILINIVNPDDNTFTSAYVMGIDVDGRPPGSVIPWAGSATREVFHLKSSLLIQPKDINALTDHFPALESHFRVGLRSFMAVPLISKGSVIAVLHFQSTKPNAYTDKDVRLAERVGNQIAGAIANAQLFIKHKKAEEAVTRLSQEHAIVAKIGRIISSTLNINEVYGQFCEEVRKVIPFDRIVITIIEHEKEVFYDEYILGVDIPGRRLGDIIPLAGSLTEKVMRTQATQVVHIEDRGELAVRFPGLLPAFDAGLRSFMSVPLISKDQVIGTLHMFSLKPKAYTEADKNLAESIGNQIAGAIANARLFTAHKNAEEAVRAEKQRFQTLSDSAPFGIVVIDNAGTFKYINPKFREIFGYDLSDTPDGRTWFRKAFPDSAHRHRAISAWVNELGSFRPGEKISKIFTVTCKDGTKKVVNFTSVKLETDEYLMCCEDITDRKHAEEALRQSEERFRELFDRAPVGYHEFDMEGRITNVNLTDLEMLGYTQEEMLGHYIWEFSVDSETVRREVLEKLKGLRAPTQNLERVYRRKDGSTFPVLIQDSLILDEQGKITGIRSIIQDITERKRAEEKLKESEERFRELAENIREVFYIAEQDTHLLSYVSPAYEEIWGRSCQSLYKEPKSFWNSIHPEDRNRVKESLTRDGQAQVEVVYRIVRPDGSIRWIKDRSFPIHNGSGKVQRIVGIAADITDLKLGEERMKYLSLHDPLTGLYNRIYFEEEMGRIGKARYDSIGIVSCDVDGLKLVNDTLGHEQGDNLLVAAAKVIRESFREGDLVARIGGDEFCIVLPNTTEADVENACERIQEAVARYNSTHPELPLSISIGSAVKKGVQENLKDLFREADNNMYREKLYRTHDVRSTMFKTLINTLSARNLMTEKHVVRLEKLLATMADTLGLSESTISDLFLLAKFHDIGEVAISDSILFKQGPLTSEEWTEMKRHCEIGYRIALSTPDLIPIAELILKHHEWWNGRGYPLGIKGEEIPIECRLFAIVDAYESMRSGRPYRRPFSHGEAVAELLNHSGKQFDPKLLRKFLNMLETPPPELGFNSPLQV